MLSQLCLKLLPREAEELTGHIAMHDVDKVLELVSICLQLADFELIKDLTVFQAMESLFQEPRRTLHLQEQL